ncbi:FAD-dependent oxidoreductase [Caulobacter flavus]|uniref:FAD-dependent oxidoreductase n=1 Tax=Caulobacter flavus TaxID=1679497 RepID=A0A2N5D632_9CAUL|nr:NAD(P)/FAD-dependent oxidoreductase [Caulobacter flavus]AYV45932.1 FAD-dependent oxidoreductase [Caulobacter flavus]PLR21525.1 FAD-dependent oxidoreductase [Caulobacter flavus]
MAFDFDAVVIGAGVVGLACGAALARAGSDVLVLESAPAIGTGTSSRNSEVIHAGMYYPHGSLKHLLCVEGRRKLYPYLRERGVEHRRCGKLIVATSDAEAAKIEAIGVQAEKNGVEGVRPLSGAEAMALEPALFCVAALSSEETGIIDSHGLMLALLGEIEDAGGALALNAPLAGAEPLAGGGFAVEVGGAEPTRLTCRVLVNSAGLQAPAVASLIAAPAPDLRPRLAKGSYFGCSVRSPFSRLIYPAPVDGGLGVHVTLDLGGRMRFGPDVEWLETIDPAQVDYRVDIARAAGFYDVIRRYWAGLPNGALTPDYSGCRPKLSGPGEAAADFLIHGPAESGIEGLVQLFGIESPGLTSSMAIADRVRDLVSDTL